MNTENITSRQYQYQEHIHIAMSDTHGGQSITLYVQCFNLQVAYLL